MIPEPAVCDVKEKAQKRGSERRGLAPCGYIFKYITAAVPKVWYIHLYYCTKLISPIKALKNCKSLSLTYHSCSSLILLYR